ncbi:bifunctional adenosylcobinamide kinase/adenosylcobinamide-phosphate guanylyltransferase [Sedimenticola thiotaurini]|uniref:Bifunctional adenosylcobalamin biosynthesis protein n=1 Tax=Sedimenticola thiotaurini TaxID=1543721 RepID=A0A0F7JT22_9GAMM|nr:bifunctional adenosylcobinamide kinase/adenosylcobinamide-phosphate guanylyltransferase [Sedimenticola thiotaurini]AKH19571.1 adenosylcobinamide kinase [Sedimenticola thiotaurini]
MKQLILGGARSGKSTLAERLAAESGDNVIYIATAAAEQSDVEMARRIQAHRDRRPDNWLLVEEPLNLAEALREHCGPGHFLIVDCLTLWLSNILLMDEGRHFKQQTTAFLSVLSELTGNLVMVSNEVGLGIVPLGEISRRFQDESGWLHQRVANSCDRVILTVAGLPLTLKGDTL